MQTICCTQSLSRTCGGGGFVFGSILDTNAEKQVVQHMEILLVGVR